MQAATLPITASTLRNFLTCERRVWLDAFGDPAARHEAPVDLAPLYALGRQHERRVDEVTLGPVRHIPAPSWDDAVRATRDLMRDGVPGIIGACFEHRAALDLSDRVFTLRGQVDQLLRVRWHGEDRYAPVEIKQRAQPVAEDWAQLDLYVWLIEAAAGTAAPGELWLGADDYGRPLRRLAHDYDEERVMALLTRLAQTLDTAVEPPVEIRAHCKTCRWYHSCTDIARREGRLELLYNVSHKTRDGLRQAGIVSLAQVAALSVEELQTVKGIGSVTAPMIRANAQAWLDRKPVRYNPVPDGCAQSGWMFDLETLADGTPWSLGWCDEHGHTEIALVAPVAAPEAVTLPDRQLVTLVPDSDSAWNVLAAAVSAQNGPIFHWTGFDAGVMHNTAPQAVIDQLGPRMHDLHASVKRCASFPLSSTSIKAISAYLGYPWQGYTDWFAAYLDYQQWLGSGDVDALTRACMYQRADVDSMAWVWRWLVHGEV